MQRGHLSFAIFFLLIYCTDPELLFEDRSQSGGINFANNLSYTEDFNPYTYRNFFNGGGVALADINNDGWLDIYFTGNIVDNKLYLNKGNWQFEDITVQAGVACSGVWSSGATFADVNNDGLLDLYVCKSGKPGGENRHNELFINQGDLTFKEASKSYGLDVEGLSVHAAFFDADNDGDLDCYVLNNSLRAVGGYDLIEGQRKLPDPEGNKFFENQDGSYIDKTTDNHFYSSAIGFGLGITLSDFNNDRKTDVFISNDFFERDYLYFNNGTDFTEVAESQFESLSMGSMGADAADLDNDLNTDLFVTEMLPATLARQKTKAKFDSWDKYALALRKGYHHQFPRNALQRNLGSAGFSELSRMTGVAATEWSWGSLIFDMDNDGLKDIFIANGIYKDLLDRDYLAYMANNQNVKDILQQEKNPVKKLIEIMPSQAVPNAAFRNKGGFDFENITTKWGLAKPSFSNGNAYGDLDNDGDLDLVINNVNMPAFVYENKTDTLTHRSIQFQLKGRQHNLFGVGAKVIIKYNQGQNQAMMEQLTSRGFQSAISNRIHFGVGNTQTVDSIIVLWPSGKTSLHLQLKTNAMHTLSEPATSNFVFEQTPVAITTAAVKHRFDFVHKENKFIDFNRDRLLPQMTNNEGPALATADLNQDGIKDVFIGGAKNQTAALFLSQKDGDYQKIVQPFEIDKNSEDTHAVFFDSDQDGDLDLYVCSGGKNFSTYDSALDDRFYENQAGQWIKKNNALTFKNHFPSSVAVPMDINQDGLLDLFIGNRYDPQRYGIPVSSHVYLNRGNNQFELSQQAALEQLGMLTDAAATDIDQDGWMDLILVGEWMPITVLKNQKGRLENVTDRYGMTQTQGLWNTIELVDLNDDGVQDWLVGNLGSNNFFEPGMKMFVNDFDQNGSVEQIICKKIGKKYYPIVDKDELISQLPQLKKKIVLFETYAQTSMQDLFTQEQLKKSWQWELKELKSSVFLSTGQSYERQELPAEVQYAPVYAFHPVTRQNGKGIALGGNQYLVKPQFGKYDASRGWFVAYTNENNKLVWKTPKSLQLRGQIRALEWMPHNDCLLVVLNDDELQCYEWN